MPDLTSVARRLEKEVGLPAADAKRIAKKLDKLADSEPWGVSIREKSESHRRARGPVSSAKRQPSKAPATKKR